MLFPYFCLFTFIKVFESITEEPPLPTAKNKIDVTLETQISAIEDIDEKENYKNKIVVFPINSQLPRQRKDKLQPIRTADYVPSQFYFLNQIKSTSDTDRDEKRDAYYFSLLDDLEGSLMDFVLTVASTREESLKQRFTWTDAAKCKTDLSQLYGELEKMQVR